MNRDDDKAPGAGGRGTGPQGGRVGARGLQDDRGGSRVGAHGLQDDGGGSRVGARGLQEDGQTGLPGLRSWRAVYAVVLISFALWVGLLIALSRAFS